MIKFDNKFEFFTVDLEEKKVFKFVSIDSLLKKNFKMSDLKKASKIPLPLNEMFSVTDYAGGTTFSKKMALIVDSVLKAKGYVILITDSDILWDKNKMILNKLIVKYGRQPFKFNIIMSDDYSYQEFIKEFRNYKYLSKFLDN
jgi:hypothetical protein